MGSLSNYAEAKVLDHMTGKASFTMPAVYIALSTADPTDDGSGLAEPSGNGYARKQTAAADWNSASQGAPSSTSNAQDITFSQATGDWGTISHFAAMDASSGGNMLWHGALTTSKPVSDGDTFKFPGGTPGNLQGTLD